MIGQVLESLRPILLDPENFCHIILVFDTFLEPKRYILTHIGFLVRKSKYTVRVAKRLKFQKFC